MLHLYNENGIIIRDIHKYQSNEVDMGEYSINCDVTIPGTASFHPEWYLSDGFNIFNLGIRKPTGKKTTDSLSTVYSLVFKHERENLKRYTYMDFIELGSGNQQPNSSIVPIRATLTEFVHRLNINLSFYMGSRWKVYLPTGYIESGNVVIYNFDNASLWDVLVKTYELYKVRWDIVSTSAQLEIHIANKQKEIEYVFEYGAEKGLISIERANPLDRIITRLRGKGSETNMPQRYFKTASSHYPGDPDANNSLQAMHFKNIMPKCYRDYVRGYNAGTGTGSWAFDKGVADKINNRPISPVDYALSNMEGLWGVSYGTLAPNEEIYPTIQEATRGNIGRVDEIIAIEEVLVDSPSEGGTAGGTSRPKKILLTDLKYKGVSENGTIYTKTEKTEDIIIDNAVNKIISEFSMGAVSTYGDTTPYIVPIEGSNVVSVSLIIKLIDSATGKDYTSWTYSNKASAKLNWENVPVGKYYIQINLSWSADKVIWIEPGPPFPPNSGQGQLVHIPTELRLEICPSSYIIYGSEANKVGYQPKFSVWIKDPWGVPKTPSETDDQYTLRVWRDLATSSDDGEITMMFSDGLLAGEDYEFMVLGKRNDQDEIVAVNIYRDETKIYNGQKSFWRIELAKSEAELKASNKYLPNTIINAKPGDHFFFIHIQMPYQPYVYDAENRVQAWLDEELAKKDEEFPTFNIIPSRIFCASFNEAGSISAGSRIRIRNTELIGSSYTTLNIQSVTKNYIKDRINPDWGITATDEIIVSGNPISLLKGTIDKLSSNVYSNREAVAQAIKALQSSFLRKDGVADTTYSPTIFKESVVIGDDGIRDDGFELGDLTGKGAAIYTDGNGNRVLETDIVVARKKIRFNEVEINQVTYSGGKQVFSAAGMIVSGVDTVAGGKRLYFDTKSSSIVNKFKLGDGAFCQRFIESGVKYYWARVIGIGSNFIDISTTDKDGEVNPTPGDNVAQLGNKTDKSRQAAFIIDVVRDGGGLVQWYDDITDFTLNLKDSVSIGRIGGKTWLKLFGNMYVGDRDKKNFIDFDGTNITFKGNVSILGGDARKELDNVDSKTKEALLAIRTEEESRIAAIVEVNKGMDELQNQIDGVVENWAYTYEPTLTNYPANEWVTLQLKLAHINDTFTSISQFPAPDAGKAWRWVESPTGTFLWTPIADSDAVKALLDAAKAMAMADGKSSTFIVQPKKYKIGDTWILDADTIVNSISYKKGDMLTSSADSETYIQAHWSKQIRYTDDTLAIQAKASADAAQSSADTASTLVGDLNRYVDGAFQDGMIDSAEAKAIEKYINAINETKLSVDATYTTLYSNVLLSGIPKDNLANAKATFNTTTTNLLSSINNAILDGLTTDAEKADVDAKYNLFNTAYASLSTRITEANTAIEQVLKGFSDAAQSSADSLKYLSDAMVKGSFGIYGGVALGQVVGVTDVGQAGDITKVQSFMSGIVANRVYFGADQQNAYNKCVTFADQTDPAILPLDDRPSFCVYRNKVDGKIRVYIKEIDIALLNTASVVHTHENQLLRPLTFAIPKNAPAGLVTGEFGLFGNPGKNVDLSILSKIRYDSTTDALVFDCGIASLKFLSARGTDPTAGSGGGGLDIGAMWIELDGNATNKIIGLSRLPIIPYSKISGTPNIPAWALQTNKPNYTWNELGSKPTEFTPSAHSHTIANITSLQSALDGKQAAGSYALSSSLNDYLPISGGTLTGALNINGNTVFHAGNANKSDVDWTAGNIAAYGYLRSISSGCTISIGSKNNAHCHYETTAPTHWFNKPLYISGDVYGGSYYNRRLAYVDEIKEMFYDNPNQIDLTGLDSNKYYPCAINCTPSRKTKIRIWSSLTTNVPPWATHAQGFTINLEWEVIGAGWGSSAIQRTVTNYNERFVNVTICGGVTQNTYASVEIIYLRGGARYNYYVSTGVAIDVHRGGYSWISGTYSYSAPIRDSVLEQVSASGDSVFMSSIIKANRFAGFSDSFYLGNEGNNGWMGCQDMCSMASLGEAYWAIHTSGQAKFQSIFGRSTMHVYAGGGNYNEGIRLYGTAQNNAWSNIHFGCNPTAVEGTHPGQWILGRNNNNAFVIDVGNSGDNCFYINPSTKNISIGGGTNSFKLNVNGDICTTEYVRAAHGLYLQNANIYYTNRGNSAEISSNSDVLYLSCTTPTLWINYRTSGVGRVIPSTINWATGAGNADCTFNLGSINLSNKLYANIIQSAGETYTGGWFRTTGDTGWYSDKWGGGIYMTDNRWVRTYGSKGFLIERPHIGNSVDQIALKVITGYDAGGGGYDCMLISSTDVATLRIAEADGTQVGICAGDLRGIITSTHNLEFHVGAIKNSPIFSGAGGRLGMSLSATGDLTVSSTISATVGIYTAGYLSARGVDPSDINKKNNIIPLHSTLEYILNTKYKSFTWKDNGELSVGIIAQDEQPREFGCLVRRDLNGSLAYSYTAHVALVGKAVQDLYHLWVTKETDQDKEIRLLKEEVKQLKQKLL